MPIPLTALSRHLRRGIGVGTKVRRIEIVFAGNANQREKGIAARIGQRSAYSLCRGDIADLAYRPFRGNPFAGRMGQDGRQAKKAGFLIDVIVAISCRPRLLRTMSNPLDSGA